MDEKGRKGEHMNTAQPIRKTEDLENLKAYYVKERPNLRNYLLVITGLNTALRISDILGLKWEDVYDFEKEILREHLLVTERKTGKQNTIFLNKNITDVLEAYRKSWFLYHGTLKPGQFLFHGKQGDDKPISRVQAYRIIREIKEKYHLDGVVSCHSLRKTFGYYAWQQGASPVLLMSIYNHSSFQVTKRYLGIEQDDRDRIFREIDL